MRERIVLDVPQGGTLQLSMGDRPVGHAITMPEGVTSVTVIVRDTAGLEQARARRIARRGTGEAPRRRRNRET